MISNKIKRYIDRPTSIDQGIKLLQLIGEDSSSIDHVKKSRNIDDVCSLLASAIGIEIKKVEKTTEKIRDAQGADIPTLSIDQKEPDAIQDIRKKAKDLHKQHSAIHQQMVSASSVEDRAHFANKIMNDIWPSLDEHYDNIREFHRTGKLPDEVNKIQQETVEKMRRYESLRHKISRTAKKVKNETDKVKKSALQYDLIKYQEQREAIKIELDL